MKKLLAIVISMAMIVAMMPVGVFADTPDVINVQDASGLKAAIDSALKDSKETHIMLQNNIENLTTDQIFNIESGKNIVLDMNKHSITVKTDFVGRPIVNEGTLKVKGEGTIDSSASDNGGYGAINNKGTLIIENGTYRGSTSARGASIKNTGKNSVLTINDGTFEKATCAVYNEGTATIKNGKFVGTTCSKCDGDIWSYTVRNTSTDSNMVINGGEFIGTQGAVSAASGYLEINNGTFKTVDCEKKHGAIFYALYVAGEVGGAECVVNGGHFETEGKEAAVLVGNDNTGGDGGINAKATTYVKGGTFIAPNGVTALKGAEKTGNPVITGGTFSSDVSAYVADGYVLTDGTVVENTNSADAVASIDNQCFKTLAGAIAAASDGDTVKLIKDIKEDITVPAGKSITIDLNSKSITNSSSDTITVAQGANLTIKSTGTVDNITHGKAALVNYGTAVLDGGTYTRSLENKENNKNDAGGNSFYTILNDKGGNMTIKDGVTVTNIGHFSSMICNRGDSTSQSASKLKINGGKFSGGLNTVKNDELGELTVTGGSFSNTSQFVIMNWHKANLSGGSFEANDSAEAVLFTSKYFENRAVGELTVTGGTYICKDNQKVLCDRYDNKEEYKGTATITGGTFSTSPKAYIAGENKVYKYNDSNYLVAASAPSGYNWTEATTDEQKSEYDFIGTKIYTGSGTPAADNVTNSPADKNTTADLAPAVKDNKAETTVDAKTADKIVDKAVENNSTEVVIDAAGNNNVASSEVAIPEKTVKELAEKTDANLVIKTDNGKVDLDKTALDAVAAQAGNTGFVRLIIETIKSDENICHVNLKLITSNGAVTDFRGGNVKVTINLTKELAAKELVCVYIDDNGIYTLVNGQKNADGTYTFTTGHFSEYAVMAKDEADKKIAEQLDTMIKDVNLKVRTSKTSKKNIKAVVSGDVKALTDAGYTVKYKFYRSIKKASKYAVLKTKADNTYINTKGKKGTKYYYKAKALVYQGDKLVGQTELKQCKYGVRTWSK